MRSLLLIVLAGLAVALPAIADWNVGDPHKRQFPQLPDPMGWDVNITQFPGVPPFRVVADDWRCSETGPVKDIHFWGSWRGDLKGAIQWIDVGTYNDVPVGPNAPYSHPGELPWFQSFHPTGAIPWQELIDPITGTSLDMALVITPEPGALTLLVCGTMVLGRTALAVPARPDLVAARFPRLRPARPGHPPQAHWVRGPESKFPNAPC